jgi:hypothetical protein
VSAGERTRAADLRGGWRMTEPFVMGADLADMDVSGHMLSAGSKH